MWSGCSGQVQCTDRTADKVRDSHVDDKKLCILTFSASKNLVLIAQKVHCITITNPDS
jgi:hypothetical protein